MPVFQKMYRAFSLEPHRFQDFLCHVRGDGYRYVGPSLLPVGDHSIQTYGGVSLKFITLKRDNIPDRQPGMPIRHTRAWTRTAF